jgi:hypothetical protein
MEIRDSKLSVIVFHLINSYFQKMGVGETTPNILLMLFKCCL